MKIGLVRHFRVDHPFPKGLFLSKSQVLDWFDAYDQTESLQYKPVDLGGTNWKRCYASTMVRAVNTASHIYPGEIVQVNELKELAILHRLNNRIKLPFLVWGMLVRIQSFSSNKDTEKFKQEIIAFLDRIISSNESETLIVSHWFVMRVMRKELLKRGFSGQSFKSNEYGTLYVFERSGQTLTSKR